MELQSSLVKNVIQKQVLNLLLVDDRPENLLTLESILERDDRHIIKASGGNEALRIAIKEEIALVLLDIQMPDIDGVEVARLLRSNKKTRHIPIIFVSAVSKSERPSLEEFEEGTIDCLGKPLNLDETKYKVAAYERMYRLQNDLGLMKASYEQIKSQLEQFVYIVSHDLKAPIRAIDNLCNWIADDLGSNADANTAENISLMRSRVNRMSSLLDGVLEYSRIGSITDEDAPLDIAQMVHGIFEAIAPPKGFALEAKELPVIKGSQIKFYKIFHNLITNAVVHHHDPENGVITVTANHQGDGIVFKVSDNGPGIKPQYYDKVFELFATLKSKDEKETTGVGLAVVKKIVDDMGQKIWIESNDPSLISFCFSYPVMKSS